MIVQIEFLEVEVVNPLFADYAEIVNETTNETETQLMGINWDGINAHMVAAVQELKQKRKRNVEI